MRSLMRWALPTLLLAAMLHVVLIWSAPELMSTVLTRWLLRNGGVGWNTFMHGALAEADGRPLPAPSPDIVYSVAFYDLSNGSVRVHCVIPETGNYWSVSFYSWNTENFFVENDRTAPGREFDLVLSSREAAFEHPAGRERVLVSPSRKGAIFLRAVVSDREDTEQLRLISEAQRKSLIVPIKRLAALPTGRAAHP